MPAHRRTHRIAPRLSQGCRVNCRHWVAVRPGRTVPSPPWSAPPHRRTGSPATSVPSGLNATPFTPTPVPVPAVMGAPASCPVRPVHRHRIHARQVSELHRRLPHRTARGLDDPPRPPLRPRPQRTRRQLRLPPGRQTPRHRGFPAQGGQHLRGRGAVAGRRHEHGALRLGQAQRAGQQHRGIPAGGAVDAPLQVTDRPDPRPSAGPDPLPGHPARSEREPPQ
jgi:hypothetical protein